MNIKLYDFSILILKLDHIGDFYLSINSLKDLRKYFPNARIDIVCAGWNRDLAESLSIFDNVYVYNFFTQKSGDWKGIKTYDHSKFLYQISSIVTGIYDVACDFRVDPDTRFLLKGIKAKSKFGFKAPFSYHYLTRSLDIIDNSDYLRKVKSINKNKNKIIFHGDHENKLSYLEPGKFGFVVYSESNIVDYSLDKSWGIESIELMIDNEVSDIKINLDNQHMYAQGDNILWALSDISPIFLKINEPVFHRHVKIKLNFYMFFDVDEKHINKNLILLTTEERLLIKFSYSNNRKSVTINADIGKNRDYYLISTNLNEAPRLEFDGFPDTSVRNKLLFFNKFSTFNELIYSLENNINSIDFNQVMPNVSLVSKNPIYIFGELYSSQRLSLSVSLKYFSNASEKCGVSLLQNRSTAFNNLSYLIKSEISIQNNIDFISIIKDLNKIKIAVNFGANSSARKWPIEHYCELLKLLVHNLNASFEIFGQGADDARDASYVLKRLGGSNIKSFVDQLSLLEASTRIADCDFYIGNNSGLGHLAAHINIPSFIIFSGTNESDRWRPFRRNIVISNAVNCSPCDLSLREECNNSMKCLDELYPLDVFKIVYNSVIK